MGPFTLLDFVGLDTTYYIANIMFEEYREPAYAPPPLLKRMVLAGRLGKKSGHGFYSTDSSRLQAGDQQRPFCLELAILGRPVGIDRARRSELLQDRARFVLLSEVDQRLGQEVERTRRCSGCR